MTPPLDSGVHLRPIFSKTRTGRHSRRIYSSPLPTPLGIFAKEVRDDDLPEYEHRVSPTHSLLPPYAAVSGGCQLARAWCERSPNVRRKVDALDGGVTGSRALKGRSKCSRNMFPIIVYAFTAHNHRVITPPCAQWSTSARSPLGGRAFSGCSVHWPLRTTSSFHGAPW